MDTSYTVPPLRAWGSVFVLVFISMVSYFDRVLMSLMIDPIKADLNITDFQISLLQGLAFGLFYAVFGLPMGWLVDRFPRRFIIYAGVTGWSLAAAFSGFARNFWHLLLCRMGIGIGEATLSPAAYSIISDLFPMRRLSLALGVFGTGGILGIAFALSAGGYLVSYTSSIGVIHLPLLGDFKPWQLTFLLAGFPGVLVAFMVFLIPEPCRRHQQRKDKVPDEDVSSTGNHFLAFLRQNIRYLSCHFLGFSCISILAYGMISWMPVFLMRRYGMDVSSAGALLGTIGATVGVGGMLFNGWIADFFFARGKKDIHLRYFALTVVVGGALGVFGFQFTEELVLFLVCYVAVYFLQPFTGPAAAHLQIVTPPEYRGRVSALFLLVMNITGQCIGPSIVAAFTDFLFGDPQMVGSSIALTFAIFSPIGSLLFYLGLKPARQGVDRMQRSN